MRISIFVGECDVLASMRFQRKCMTTVYTSYDPVKLETTGQVAIEEGMGCEAVALGLGV